MQEMEEMLLLAVPLEDRDAVQAETVDLLIPVRPFSYVIIGMSADEIGKGGQANGGSVNEVNNGWVLFLRRFEREKERWLIVGYSTSTPWTSVLETLGMGEMQVPETL
jgi:hypothetical protein